MTVYTIEAVGDPRPWENDKGSFLAYPLKIKDHAGTLEAEWSRKATSPAPQLGAQIEADLETGQYGNKLRNVKAPGSGGGSGGGERSYQADPKKQAAIAMEHSQSLAWEMARFVVEHNIQGEAREQLEKDFATYASRLFRMVKEASDGA